MCWFDYLTEIESYAKAVREEVMIMAIKIAMEVEIDLMKTYWSFRYDKLVSMMKLEYGR